MARIAGLSFRSLLGAGLGLILVAVLIGLGIWQLERREWKLALIARVEARVHAAPVVAPDLATEKPSDVARLEYTRVTATGHFLNDRETLVEAVTIHGGGAWVMTPLVTDSGLTILVNRGFVPFDKKPTDARTAGQLAGEVTVTGLLRPSEPRGGFLRENDPPADRWYSRDVKEIADKRGLSGEIEPYFIDADATANPGGYPIGGLTVINFPNNHLVYALTWFAMGLGLLGVMVWLFLRGRRRG